MSYFWGFKIEIATKVQNSRINGRGYSFCSICTCISLECQECCHENFISYKANSKVDIWDKKNSVRISCAITFC